MLLKPLFIKEDLPGIASIRGTAWLLRNGSAFATAEAGGGILISVEKKRRKGPLKNRKLLKTIISISLSFVELLIHRSRWSPIYADTT